MLLLERIQGKLQEKIVDTDLAEVVKKNRQVLQMKRELKQIYLCESNIKAT